MFATPVVVYPPKAKPVVLPEPDPFNKYLAVAKSFTSVQEVPFQDSVFAIKGDPPLPPYTKLSVYVEELPPSALLAEFISFTSVQEAPFHDSVLST